MIMTFFIEHYGYYFDQVLMSESAGYIRNAFVLASLGESSEHNHLDKILNDAICTEPIDYDGILSVSETTKEKYSKYQTDDYIPTKHKYIE